MIAYALYADVKRVCPDAMVEPGSNVLNVAGSRGSLNPEPRDHSIVERSRASHRYQCKS